MKQSAAVGIKWANVAALRDMRELSSDAELAEAMGVHRTTVYRVFKRKTSPSPEFLGALCQALGAKPEHLLCVEPQEGLRAA